MWQFERNKLKKNNEQVRLFVDNLNIIALCNLREAFFGGKNNAIKFYHKVQDDDDQITPCCIPLQALNVDIPWDICSSLISQTQLTFPSFIDW